MRKFYESLNSLDRELNVIRCPVCGQEYLAAELFLPDDLLGKPVDIVKTTDGKVDFYLGEKPTLETTYNCDNCFTTFKVKARIQFDTAVETANAFDSTYVSKLKTPLRTVQEVNLFDDNDTTED